MYKHSQAFTSIHKYLQAFTSIYKHSQAFTSIYKDLQAFTRQAFTSIYIYKALTSIYKREGRQPTPIIALLTRKWGPKCICGSTTIDEALPIPTFFVLILYFLQVDFRQIWCVNLNILRCYRFHSIYHQTDVQIHRHRTKRPRVICHRVICHRVKQHRIKRPRVKNATKSKMT